MLDINSKGFECTSSSHYPRHSVGNDGVFCSRLTLLELGMHWTLNPKSRHFSLDSTHLCCAKASLAMGTQPTHLQLPELPELCMLLQQLNYRQCPTFKGATAWVCEVKVLTFLLAVSYSEITPKSSFPFSYEIIITTRSTQLVRGWSSRGSRKGEN